MCYKYVDLFPDLPQATENTSKWQQHFPVFQHNNGTFSLTFTHPIQVELRMCEHQMQTFEKT